MQVFVLFSSLLCSLSLPLASLSFRLQFVNAQARGNSIDQKHSSAWCGRGEQRTGNGGEGFQVHHRYLHDLADRANSLCLCTCGHMLEARGHLGAARSPISILCPGEFFLAYAQH